MATRDTLIEATSELLWERGYSGTSPAMIQKRAHAGQGSMYHHFSGKADLATAAMTHSADLLRQTAEATLGTGETAIERVTAYLDMERDPLAGCRIGRLVQDADIVDDQTLRLPAAEFFAWLVERITQVFTEGVERGELRPDVDARAAASLVVASVQGAYVLARALEDPASFARAMDAAKQAVRALSHGTVA
ncbi:TetR family transcriptional regulator C-terminal domain-containing protein [Nonomuraea sp. NPDC050536]|uniref:TetR family transcriptional regulator C-terminal domain-containing protein n=1 Tax=Nonomuraea sp. NPDC050536 TaxID=3364366 RepID=UPI0037C86535